MKRDNKKALYESIMASVAKEVKKALNENVPFNTTLGKDNMEKLIQSFNNVKHSLANFNDLLNAFAEKDILGDEDVNPINGDKGSYLSNIQLIMKQISNHLTNVLEKHKIN